MRGDVAGPLASAPPPPAPPLPPLPVLLLCERDKNCFSDTHDDCGDSEPAEDVNEFPVPRGDAELEMPLGAITGAAPPHGL